MPPNQAKWCSSCNIPPYTMINYGQCTRPWRTRKLLLKQIHHNYHPIATVPPTPIPVEPTVDYIITNTILCDLLTYYNDHPLHTSDPTMSPCQPPWLSPLQLLQSHNYYSMQADWHYNIIWMLDDKRATIISLRCDQKQWRGISCGSDCIPSMMVHHLDYMGH